MGNWRLARFVKTNVLKEVKTNILKEVANRDQTTRSGRGKRIGSRTCPEPYRKNEADSEGNERKWNQASPRKRGREW